MGARLAGCGGLGSGVATGVQGWLQGTGVLASRLTGFARCRVFGGAFFR